MTKMVKLACEPSKYGQSDLSFHWVHMPINWFVFQNTNMNRLLVRASPEALPCFHEQDTLCSA